MISIEKLSIEELRTLIPDSDKLSDPEMERISQTLYNFAYSLFKQWLSERNKTRKSRASSAYTLL